MKLTTIFCLLVFITTSFCRSGNISADSLAKNKNLNTIQENAAIDDSYVPPWHSFITNLPTDWTKFTKVTFTTDKIPLYLGVAGVTTALILTDDATWKAQDKWKKSSNTVTTLSDVFTFVGDGRSQFGLAAAFAAYGFIANDNRSLRTASQVTEAVLASGAVVQVLKHLTGRQSPSASSEPGGDWTFFPNQVKYHKHVSSYDAFPSGHLTTFLATVFVISENYHDIWWVKPAGFALGTGLAIGMVNNSIHWYSDYPLAIVLGYTFGMIVSHPEGKHPSLLGESEKLSLSPVIEHKGLGLGFRLKL